jgi:hypothetical protein
MKRKILITALIIIVFGSFLAYHFYTNETEDVVNQQPDIRMHSDKLVAAFEQDSSSAIKNYRGKVIEVTGTVKKIDTSGTIILGTNSSESSVVFSLDRRHMQDYKTTAVGNEAVIQGKCTGFTPGEDMLGVTLGTTIEFNFAGIKKKNQK